MLINMFRDMQIMLGVAGSFSILLPEPPAFFLQHFSKKSGMEDPDYDSAACDITTNCWIR